MAGAAVYAVLNRTVLRPVASMSHAVHAYREGDIGYRIKEPQGNDEVADLARDVNAMAQELQDLYTGLEQRVEERTAELQSLNNSLSTMLTDQQQNLEIAMQRLQEEREAMARRALEPVHVGVFEFDPAKFTVAKNGQDIALTPKEFTILFTLASRAGEVVSQQELVKAAWGEDYTEEMASLAVYIRRIRKKVEYDPANPKFVQTAWGEGYRFSTGE